MKSKGDANPSDQPEPQEPTPPERTPEEERYVQDLLVRGEAAKPDENGKLPLEATAEITKEYPDGRVEVKNVRKKLF